MKWNAYSHTYTYEERQKKTFSAYQFMQRAEKQSYNKVERIIFKLKESKAKNERAAERWH